MDVDPAKRIVEVLLQFHEDARRGHDRRVLPERPTRYRLRFEDVPPVDQSLLDGNRGITDRVQLFIPRQVQLV
jgi:hypothetical protein